MSRSIAPGRLLAVTSRSRASVLRRFVLLAFVLVVAPLPLAGASQASDYTITADVAGNTITVAIADISIAVGTLEITLRGVPPLAAGECAIASGSGACAQVDDVVRIVGFNLTGWQEPTVIAELEFEEAPTGAELVLERGTDINGLDLVGNSELSAADASSATAESSGTGWIVPVVIVAALGLLAGLVAKTRRTGSTSHPA